MEEFRGMFSTKSALRLKFKEKERTLREPLPLIASIAKLPRFTQFYPKK
jgi:hypothetical protein